MCVSSLTVAGTPKEKKLTIVSQIVPDTAARTHQAQAHSDSDGLFLHFGRVLCACGTEGR